MFFLWGFSLNVVKVLNNFFLYVRENIYDVFGEDFWVYVFVRLRLGREEDFLVFLFLMFWVLL